MQVYRGYEVVALPDLSRMKVQVFVEESRISLIQVGQPVRVWATALGETPHLGKVSAIDGVPRDVADQLDSGQRQRVGRPERRAFEVSVRLSKQDPRLKPGLNAVVAIEVERISDCLVVPHAAVAGTAGKHFLLEHREDGAKRREVKVRAVCDNWAAVEGDMRAGMRVLLAEL